MTSHSTPTNRTLLVIGLGKLSRSILKMLLQNKETVKDLSAFRLTQFGDIESIQYDANSSELFTQKTNALNKFDFIWVTVPDREIAPTIIRLSTHFEHLLSNETTIFHSSGTLSHDVLKPLSSHKIASAHLAQTFIGAPLSPETCEKTALTLEGNERAIDSILTLLGPLGFATHFIQAADKVKYHLACVYASNFMPLLITHVEKLLSDIGLEKSVVRALSEQSLKNCFEYPASDTLTGPLQRGDLETLTQHMSCLTSNEKQQYAKINQQFLDLFSKKGLINNASNIEDFLLKIARNIESDEK